MDVFIKAASGTMIVLILCLMQSKQSKEYAVLIAIAACGMLATVALSAFMPIVDFVEKLQNLGGLNEESLDILLKSIGIGLIGELVALICADSGNASLGKAVQILSVVVITVISLPLFTTLLELVEEILGNI